VKVVSVLSILALVSCHDSSANPSDKAAPATASPTKRHEVKGYCSGSVRARANGGSETGLALDIGLMLALEGTETTTKLADAKLQDIDPKLKQEHVGDKRPLRYLLSLTCDAYVRNDGSLTDDALRGGPACDATLLDLAGLDAGKPFSSSLFPLVQQFWAIRSITPAMDTIELGTSHPNGDDIVITGIARDDKTPTNMTTHSLESLDLLNAHVSWIYSIDSSWGSSRVELAADCTSTWKK
jgi:hypothetical protein